MTTKNSEPPNSHADAGEPTLSIYNAPALAKLYQLLIEPGQVVELRAISVQFSSGRPHSEAGFFDSNHLLPVAKEGLRLSKVAKGVYFTLNPLHHDLLARRCNRVAWAAEGELAKDKNVLARRWLLVDVDPVRDALISATDAEKEHAWDTVQAVREFWRSKGWPAPWLADSGSGFHLLYRIDLPADDGRLVRGVLQALAHRFDSAAAKIDQAVFNPARREPPVTPATGLSYPTSSPSCWSVMVSFRPAKYQSRPLLPVRVSALPSSSTVGDAPVAVRK